MTSAQLSYFPNFHNNTEDVLSATVTSVSQIEFTVHRQEKCSFLATHFKGIVSRDFEWLQMILMDGIVVPDVPLEVYSFLNLHFHIVL